MRYLGASHAQVIGRRHAARAELQVAISASESELLTMCQRFHRQTQAIDSQLGRGLQRLSRFGFDLLDDDSALCVGAAKHVGARCLGRQQGRIEVRIEFRRCQHSLNTLAHELQATLAGTVSQPVVRVLPRSESRRYNRHRCTAVVSKGC